MLQVQNRKMWICKILYQFMKESVLGENFINGNFMIGFHFLYLMKDITLHCKLLPIHMLFSVLWNPESYIPLCVLRLTKCQRLFILQLQYQASTPTWKKKKTCYWQLNYLVTTQSLISNISYNLSSILHKGAQEKGPFQVYCIWKVTHNICKKTGRFSEMNW